MSETVDTDLLDWQQKVRSNAGTLKKELEESQKSLNSLKEPVVSTSAEHSIKSSVKYAIIGFFAGGFMAVFAVSVQYILNDKVTSDKEIRNRFGLKSLGAFYQAPRKRMLGFIDSWLRRMAGDDKVWPGGYGAGLHGSIISGGEISLRNHRHGCNDIPASGRRSR